ncbi:MAG: glycosyltransferase [Patescibacteria group bacterium]
MVKVSIIIPTYNEAKNLPPLVEEIFSHIDRARVDLEIIFVDDNSPDGTGQVAEELAQKYPVKVVHRSGKLGLGSAVREGFSHSDRPLLGVMDADLSHDPAEIGKMIDLLNDYDLVLASRFQKGSVVEQWKWWRKIISRIGVGITYILTGVKDPLSGFFFLRRGVIEGVELDTKGYKILLEILVKGNQKKVKEVPFRFRIRKFSTSKLDSSEYGLFLKQILIYSWYKIKKNWLFWLIVIFAAGLLFFRVSYRTFWMDETMVLNYFKDSLGGFLSDYWVKPDNHPPLYYFLVLLFSKILPWSELTVRLVSILSGLGIVALVYVFTKRVTQNKNLALVTAFFTAFSSYFVLISQMARYHGLAAFFSLLCFYFFYRLYFEGYDRRTLIWYLITLVLVGYSDYPHFVYVALITNVLFLYRLIRKKSITSFWRWVIGQLIAAAACLPLVWMIYQRVAVQGDGGWDKVNLLANSWLSLTAGVFFHIYSFFFGENILPWNFVIFGLGCVVLGAIIYGLIYGVSKKNIGKPQMFIILLSVALVIINTLFMNKADPRYNFIVYPKFGFVAFPLFIMSFVFCLNSLRSRGAKLLFYALWVVVAAMGLINFYQAKNYLNASYFRTFAVFDFVRDHSRKGQYLATGPDASEGLYNFYKQKYFSDLLPVQFEKVESQPKGVQIWYFTTASDATGEAMGTDTKIPPGYKILERYDSVPLDPTLAKLREKILHYPSYIYKYTVFLLEKI